VKTTVFTLAQDVPNYIFANLLSRNVFIIVAYDDGVDAGSADKLTLINFPYQ
jgi:hypothetical protein